MSRSYNNADMTTLDEFESRLQSLLEVHLLKHLPGYKVEDGIAQQLATAMQAHLKQVGNQTQAPNLYVIIAQPANLERWHANPHLFKELANALYTAGKEAGFHFSIKPSVTTTAEDGLSADEVHVVASFSDESVAETKGISRRGMTVAGAAASPDNAFLILGGNKLVPINRSVTNIGRRLDNHVVIDDPRVSRAHAQLRVVRNRFVLFDLNSSGGTYVNGLRSSQSILYPGDVISLAGVTLIFGQDLPGPEGASEDQTHPGQSLPADPASRKENNSVK